MGGDAHSDWISHYHESVIFRAFIFFILFLTYGQFVEYMNMHAGLTKHHIIRQIVYIFCPAGKVDLLVRIVQPII